MKIEKIVGGIFLTNCYLLIGEREIIVIDPGFEPEKIIQEAERHKKRIKKIILTHYHPDHTLGAKELKRKTGAMLMAGEKEKDFLNLEIDKFLKEGEKIKINQKEILVIETPGHSKGSISLLGDDFIFLGDLIFEEGIGRTDLKGGSEEDLKSTFEKLKKILKKGTIIYPGHGNEFVYEKERFEL